MRVYVSANQRNTCHFVMTFCQAPNCHFGRFLHNLYYVKLANLVTACVMFVRHMQAADCQGWRESTGCETASPGVRP
jgi:hypothetical protein